MSTFTHGMGGTLLLASLALGMQPSAASAQVDPAAPARPSDELAPQSQLPSAQGFVAPARPSPATPATQISATAAQPTLLVQPAPSRAAAPVPALSQGARVLTLDVAVQTARSHALEIAQADASVEAAEARIDAARSPLLPQLSGALGYERSTSNSGFTSASSVAAANAGSVSSNRSRISLATRNQFSASLRASQLVYDFGQSLDGLRAAQASARAEEHSARATWLAVEYSVRSAFLDAGAARALVGVAQESLANQERHLAQIQGFVEVGTRPSIDLAQSRTEVATARLSLLRAENSYAVAKSQLTRAMGHDPGPAFEVSSELPGAEAYENAGVDRLLDLASRSRPEFAAFDQQVRAQSLNVSANESGGAPSLQVVGNVDEAGSELDSLALNLGLGVNLSWPIFQGGLVDARVRESRAVLSNVRIQRELLIRDTRQEIEQAVLSLKAAEAGGGIAEEIVVNATDRLALAEGRYSAGVGNVIELGDAQLVLSEAQAQRVSADYELAQARALLRRALGRSAVP